MERVGVNWHEMNLDQRRAGHALLRTALSSQGFFKAVTIMSLEQELRRMETDRPGVEQIRDPEKYWFALFGDPASDEPWGWRIEGHHLSLNFSSVTGQVVSVTPAFFGANPAELRDGPRAGLRVLGAEEDLGRKLITSCSARAAKRRDHRGRRPWRRDRPAGPGDQVRRTRRTRRRRNDGRNNRPSSAGCLTNWSAISTWS